MLKGCVIAKTCDQNSLHVMNDILLVLDDVTSGQSKRNHVLLSLCPVLAGHDWWRVLEAVRQAARKIFTAPSSTAGIERTFNLCGILFFEKRQRTTDENFEQMILSKVNLLYGSKFDAV